MASSVAGSGPEVAPVAKRLAIEMAPLLVFFGTYELSGFMTATAAFMVAVLLVTGVSYALERRLPVVPAVATVAALVTGALTLGLEEQFFVKIRPTVLNGLYGSFVLGSMLTGHNLLERVLGGSLRLTDEGWRGLAWRVGLFLLCLAACNELVWRSFSTDVWVSFKVFAIVPLDALFALALWPYVKCHWSEPRS